MVNYTRFIYDCGYYNENKFNFLLDRLSVLAQNKEGIEKRGGSRFLFLNHQKRVNGHNWSNATLFVLPI